MHTQPQTLIEEKLVRCLDQDAGAVTRIGLAAAGAPVLHIFQYGERIRYRLVVLVTFYIGDETDAAGIMLEQWIVQT